MNKLEIVAIEHSLLCSIYKDCVLDILKISLILEQ
jgi:hypothetical protein